MDMQLSNMADVKNKEMCNVTCQLFVSFKMGSGCTFSIG